MRRFAAVAVIAAANLIVFTIALFAFTPVQASDTLSGVIAVHYGDNFDNPVILITLTTDSGQSVPLDVPPDVLSAAGGVYALMGARATVTTAADADLTAANAALPVTAIAIQSAAGSLNGPLVPQTNDPTVDSPALTGNHSWLNLLCKFAGTTAEPYSQSQIQGYFANAFPLQDQWWRENSFNQVTMTATTSVWRTLPLTRSQYLALGSASNYLAQIFADCTAAHSAFYTYINYTGTNLWLNTQLDGSYWGTSCRFTSLQGSGNRCWRNTWLPYYGSTDHGVYSHEIGHAYGLPHADNFDGDSNPYDSAYDVMSAACANVSGFFCVGMHTNSDYKDSLTYYTAGQRFNLTTNGTFPITLDAISEPITNYGMVRVPINGSQSIAIESRRRDLSQYDTGLPASGVVVWHVDDSLLAPARQWGAVIDDAAPLGLGVFSLDETYRDFVNGFSFTVVSNSVSGHNISLFRGNMGASPDLNVSVVSTVTHPGRITLTLRVTNQGTVASESAFLVVGGSANLSVNILALPSGCTANGAAIACDLGDMAAGATVDRVFDVRPTLSSTTIAPGIATSNDNETDMADNRLNASLPAVNPLADAAVTISQVSPRVPPGGTADYTVRVLNPGGAGANSVNVTVTVSGGASITGYSFEYRLFEAPSCSFIASDQMECDINFIGSFSEYQEELLLFVDATSSGGPRVATANVSMTQTDALPSNNTAQVFTAFGLPVNVTGTMVFPGRPLPGATLVETVPLAITHVNTGLPYTVPPTVTTNTSGQFTVGNIGEQESYKFRIQPPGALSVVRTTGTLFGSTANIDFGTLKMGDANGDNVVNVTDFSLLASTFGLSSGAGAYDDRADFDNNGAINVADFSLLASSFGQAGME